MTVKAQRRPPGDRRAAKKEPEKAKKAAGKSPPEVQFARIQKTGKIVATVATLEIEPGSWKGGFSVEFSRDDRIAREAKRDPDTWPDEAPAKAAAAGEILEILHRAQKMACTEDRAGITHALRAVRRFRTTAEKIAKWTSKRPDQAVPSDGHTVRSYEAAKGRTMFVHQGFTNSDNWATFSRRPTGGLRRFKSPELPERELRHGAQQDLDRYAASHGWAEANGQAKPEGQQPTVAKPSTSTALVPVTATAVPALTSHQERTLRKCEEQIADAHRKHFLDSARALRTIHEEIYKDKRTFADYCHDRWGLDVSHAYRVLKAIDLFDEVAKHKGGDLLAWMLTTESQWRELTKVERIRDVMTILRGVERESPRDATGRANPSAKLIASVRDKHLGVEPASPRTPSPAADQEAPPERAVRPIGPEPAEEIESPIGHRRGSTMDADPPVRAQEPPAEEAVEAPPPIHSADVVHVDPKTELPASAARLSSDDRYQLQWIAANVRAAASMRAANALFQSVLADLLYRLFQEIQP